ncbi:hypothetical protein EJ06DRAFT_545803 [Trichodelitschia bisporula]|uniref:DNA-directed RNA polymerase III RPC4 n=1 Tax=Trichodelitschia bisporula TaxID=703511 RepID=A0A6G1IAX6_9PEZI|nr:hypothetical protein EJ06DRAFT_545803 [Trichodelitschia bisporula]
MPEPSRGRAKKVVAPRGKGRRTQAERDQISQLQAERTREKETQYAEEQDAARRAAERAERFRSRGRGAGRGRGRGGFMGEATSAVQGPLSAGSVIGGHISVGKSFPRPWMSNQKPASFNVKREAITAIKSEGGSSGNDGMAFSRLNIEDGGYISSDPDEPAEGPREDVDFINLADESDSDQVKSAALGGARGHRSASAFAPVRIIRVEHKDRAPPINPEISAGASKKEPDDAAEDTGAPSSSKGKQRAKDVVVIKTERKWHGVYSSDDDEAVKVKDEPMEDVTSSARPPVVKEPLSAPTSPNKSKIKLPRAHHKNKPFLLTEEDRAEYARKLRQTELLLAELGPVSAAEPTTTGEDSAPPPPDPRADRVYWFQFPPKMPDLLPNEPIAIKDDAPVAATHAGTAPEETVPGKPEPSAADGNAPVTVGAADAKATTPNKERPEHLPKLASGNVGKMRVHKSGKVTMDWGGTSFQVKMGVEWSHLQDVVLVKSHEKDKERSANTAAGPDDGSSAGAGSRAAGAASRKGGISGDTYAFGQVKGMFVVTPDWDELL